MSPRWVPVALAIATWMAATGTLAAHGAKASGSAEVVSASGGGDSAPGIEAAAPARRPALVVVIAIDQLRRDRLDPTLPGGLGRLAREGRVFADALLDHAVSSTCGGHVTLITGRHPGPAGVADNRFVDRRTMDVRFCVDDRAPDAVVLGAPDVGRSPRLFRASALGDWMKRADPETRVVSVSGKDRAAIALGGQGGDGVYWYEAEVPLGFTTSRYYRDALPAWVRAFNGSDVTRDGALARLPETWEHRELAAQRLRPDDYAAESDRYGRTSGHPLHDSDAQVMAEQIFSSPYLDQLTLDFARQLVESENLGARGVTDLLALSLSATDVVGHLYGPESHEARDALLRLDAWLAGFLTFLEERAGAGGLLVALSADHGVLPLPERLEETGRGECPVAGGRTGLTWLSVKLFWRLHRELAPLLSFPAEWIRFSGMQATVNVPVAKEHGVEVDEVVRVVERQLESEPAIREVWTRDEIQQRKGALADLYRHSFDPEKTGDVTVQFEPTCLISPRDSGTSHGSPYEYDRAVPLVFWGAGIAPGVVGGPAASVDLAPTLAGRLGIEVPDELDGRDLLGGESASRIIKAPGYDGAGPTLLLVPTAPAAARTAAEEP